MSNCCSKVLHHAINEMEMCACEFVFSGYYSNYALKIQSHAHMHISFMARFPLVDIDVVQVACTELCNPNFQFLITKNDVDKALNSYQVRSLIFLHVCQQDAVVLVCMHRNSVLVPNYWCSKYSIKATFNSQLPKLCCILELGNTSNLH